MLFFPLSEDTAYFKSQVISRNAFAMQNMPGPQQFKFEFASDFEPPSFQHAFGSLDPKKREAHRTPVGEPQSVSFWEDECFNFPQHALKTEHGASMSSVYQSSSSSSSSSSSFYPSSSRDDSFLPSRSSLSREISTEMRPPPMLLAREAILRVHTHTHTQTRSHNRTHI